MLLEIESQNERVRGGESNPPKHRNESGGGIAPEGTYLHATRGNTDAEKSDETKQMFTVFGH